MNKSKEDKDIEAELLWYPINAWDKEAKFIARKKSAKSSPWEYTPILHPKLEENQRCAVTQDGLFLENAVQMQEGTCLVYLSTHPLEKGCYKFGGGKSFNRSSLLQFRLSGNYQTEQRFIPLAFFR